MPALLANTQARIETPPWVGEKGPALKVNDNMVKKQAWPVKLFWLPYGSPIVVPLGLVSSSFLLKKRRRLGQGGCLVALDVNRQSPPGGASPLEIKTEAPPESQSLEDDKGSKTDPEAGNGCSQSHRLRRKARLAIRFFESQLGVKRAYALPSRIQCGHLRSAVRSCFDSNLEMWQELSLKTTQKLEKSFCRGCRDGPGQESFIKWQEERIRESSVDPAHLALFRAQLGRNVVRGWNRGKWPYIPNGHACLGASRCQGGTWNKGTFTTEVDYVPVISAGKPRVVTLHSEYNTSVLYPLHKALYGTLKRKGWLLVGSPTNEIVSSLNGCGNYVSVDYKSATDNIKTEYTRAAIEELIEKGVDLSDDDKRCLRAVGTPDSPIGTFVRGQPMGSLMSFPLLCLVNKTVVDLAHNVLLENREISFKEWTSHRCIVNGDDLLYRDFKQCPGRLLEEIKRHGELIGLVVNDEKTGVDPEYGEINSTVFRNGVQQKKANVSALFMGKDVIDVIGFADRSSITDGGFLDLIWRARELLGKQDCKIPSPLPFRRFRLLIKDRRLRPYLLSYSELGPTFNLFPVVPMPDGYSLTREEECIAINREVERLRAAGRKNSGRRPEVVRKGFRSSLRSALKRKLPPDDRILSVLASEWKEKQYRNLLSEDSSVGWDLITPTCGDELDLSTMELLLRKIRSDKKEWSVQAQPGLVPVHDWDFIPLED
nr:MAG: putative RNA-dependent RNA polymerase [Magnaporthe oryzae botourmiavirus 5]